MKKPDGGPASGAAVLVVEDEAQVVLVVRRLLEPLGCSVAAAASIAEARAALSKSAPDLVILDRLLPDGDGALLCRELRRDARLGRVPVLFLTVLGDEAAEVEGLRAGGDDYLQKPFSGEVLAARVEALLRRSARGRPERPRWRCGGLALDAASHRCEANGREVRLRPKEFEVLRLLIERAGELLARDLLARAVWGTEDVVDTRTVDTTVQRLRRRLGPLGRRIETIRGYGFRLSRG